MGSKVIYSSKSPKAPSVSVERVAYALHNHIRIVLEFNDDHSTNVLGDSASASTIPYTLRIVNFRVETASIQHKWDGAKFEPGKTPLRSCSTTAASPLNSANPVLVAEDGHVPEDSKGVVFTYDVLWQHSATPWANRWDVYFTASHPNDKVHWFSISNSIVIVLFLSITIGTILVKALRKDIAQYNDMASLEEAREESGWKLVHGDVFRPPAAHPMLFRYRVSVSLCVWARP